jgi:hypothetical protein
MNCIVHLPCLLFTFLFPLQFRNGYRALREKLTLKAQLPPPPTRTNDGQSHPSLVLSYSLFSLYHVRNERNKTFRARYG